MIIKGADRPASLGARSKQTTLAARGARLDATLRARHFSGSALIVDRGRVLLERGYGLADRTSGRANTADTLFDVGSVTKQFVAAAILQGLGLRTRRSDAAAVRSVDYSLIDRWSGPVPLYSTRR